MREGGNEAVFSPVLIRAICIRQGSIELRLPFDKYRQ